MRRIIIIDDEKAVSHYLETILKRLQYEAVVFSSLERALAEFTRVSPCVALLNMEMRTADSLAALVKIRSQKSAPQVIGYSAGGQTGLAVKAMKAGAFDYILKPIEPDRLVIAIEQASQLRQNESASIPQGASLPSVSEIAHQSPQMEKLIEQAKRTAVEEKHILLWGEKGTGKELLARYVCGMSRRADKPFAAVDSTVFASQIIASHKLAHGSYGAYRSQILEEASGGTVYLKEIGELSLSLQTKLFRLLLEGELYNSKTGRSSRCDARIIASTDRDLSGEATAGNFRADLFYRLKFASLFVPPLRKREGDVRFLAERFLGELAAKHGKKARAFSPEAAKMLEKYQYPGNVAELIRIINGAVLLETGLNVTQKSLPQYFLDAVLSGRRVSKAEAEKTLAQVEKEHIEKALSYVEGNRTAAAKILGISRAGLIGKIKIYNLS